MHARIADRLAREGLPLLAQHVDPIDAGTLVDIFRDDPRASLLGTDALRDGVDVPGESLRLVVMERVPWPRPTVLHAARRMAGGGSAYDDRVVRARLAQAFGRLIRRQGDCGLFVILSAAMPSRLLGAFRRACRSGALPLDQAIARVEERLADRRERCRPSWWNEAARRSCGTPSRAGMSRASTISTGRSTSEAGRPPGAWAANSSAANALRSRAGEHGGAGARDARRPARGVRVRAPIRFDPGIYHASEATCSR